MPALGTPCDVLVIGGGPAGQAAALRASALGARTVLAERTRTGGACLHWACIPTKFLRHTADLIADLESAGRFGLQAAPAGLDWAALRARQQGVIDLLAAGARESLKASNVEVVEGEARFVSAREAAVQTTASQQNFAFRNVIIASGSTPIGLKISGAERALPASSLTGLEKLPASLAIIGGGAVGTELASIFSRLGCRVTIVELMPSLLPAEDGELTDLLGRALQLEGVKVLTGARVSRLETDAANTRVVISGRDGEQSLAAELVAVAVGQAPDTEGLGLANCGLACPPEGLPVDEHMMAAPGIFAAGDVTGKAMFAYVAILQGRIAAENAMGYGSVMDYRAVPHCIFTRPELASVGINESGARAKGLLVRVGRAQFAANAAATILGQRKGLVKIVAEQESGRVLGVHALGPSAHALISEATLAVRLGVTAAELSRTLHPHPTLSEALWEAARDAAGNSPRA